MISVADIYDEAKRIVGNSNDKFLFTRITDAVELLANKGDWDPLLGTLDICTPSRVVTLPPEVEVILACNMVGRPAIARDEFFQFHLNGPGSIGWGNIGPIIRWEWMDLSDACTYRELPAPRKLMAYCLDDADINAELWVFGLDEFQNAVRSQLPDGTWVEGWRVPVNKVYTAPSALAPTFSRITAVRKAATAGPIRLFTMDEVLLGVYQGNETLPKYRRIQLSRNVDWVRIRFRRRTFEIRTKYDLIPLHNKQSVLMMLRALKAYGDGNLPEAEGYEATAVRWLSEEQMTSNPPVAAPIQVMGSGNFLEPYEYMD